MGLEVKYVTPWLSHHKTGGLKNPSSLNKVCTQISSTMVFARDLYSALVQDLATMYYLLNSKELNDCQEIYKSL